MKLKNNEVQCDICHKKIKEGEMFRNILVHKVTYKDKYFHEAMSDCEKDLDVCNNCILNMNFGNIVRWQY